ncbi:Uncharacterized protein Adt_16383 [Abeliophyllum distichum]|uniref:Uncharacterized protein n=1 Tax=Abeliophyllum distichum TaxID=126358 RepID=A0ABD1TE21_9LAMI
MPHLVLPSLQRRLVSPPSPNGCSWVGGSGSRPCHSSFSEKSFAGRIMAASPPPPLGANNGFSEQNFSLERLLIVGRPSPNSCSWVGGGGGRPCRSSISEKNFAGHNVAAPPPPPPLADDNAYPEQMVRFGMATDRK